MNKILKLLQHAHYTEALHEKFRSKKNIVYKTIN